MPFRFPRAATILLVGMTAMTLAAAQPAPNVLSVYAAGSLRGAMNDLSRAFERAGGPAVKLTFGASGLLKDRIDGGEAAQVFASANMNHPQALQASGRAEAVRPFARNTLCLLASPAFQLAGQSLPQRLLDTALRVGTSTPGADPSGDYAFEMFDRMEATGATGPGSAAALKAKALRLTGGPRSPQPEPGRNLYGQLIGEGRADVFITYCTNAAEARQQEPALQVLPIPAAFNVGAVYGLATMSPAGASAQAFVDFVTSAAGQQILAAHGFSAP